MDFNPLGLRAMRCDLKANTLLDTVARQFTEPMRKTGGKLLKDDSSAKGVQDYLAEKYLHAHIRKRKGRHEPTER